MFTFHTYIDPKSIPWHCSRRPNEMRSVLAPDRCSYVLLHPPWNSPAGPCSVTQVQKVPVCHRHHTVFLTWRQVLLAPTLDSLTREANQRQPWQTSTLPHRSNCPRLWMLEQLFGHLAGCSHSELWDICTQAIAPTLPVSQQIAKDRPFLNLFKTWQAGWHVETFNSQKFLMELKHWQILKLI